jgi:diadenosine tetraphosphate (Ap4A) HIT family hydrolase
MLVFVYHAQVTAPRLRFATKEVKAMKGVIELHLHIHPERRWQITVSNPSSKKEQTFSTLEELIKHLEGLCPPPKLGLR